MKICYFLCYVELLASVAPLWVPRLALQCIAAPLGGITAAMITNPLDVSRARIQVCHSC